MRKILPRQYFDKWLYGGLWKQIAVFLLFALVIFFLLAGCIKLLFGSYIGYSSDLKGHELWQLYYYFADPGNQMSMHESGTENGVINGISRWIGLIVSTLGSVFLSGLLISTITNVFERRADKWRAGFSYYKLKDHFVIIGSDQMVHGLVNQLCENFSNPIVVMTSKDVEQMRNSLHATLKDPQDKERIIVNYGLRNSARYLAAINAMHAKEVYILGDTSEFDDIESFHDSLNVQCMTLIAELCRKSGRKHLPCHVLFDYKTTYHVFQYADLSPQITECIDFHPFNFYDSWARKVLVAGYSKEDNIKYKPLDYKPITSRESDSFVHFIVIGMSQMGQAMALQAAHIAHFPNYRKRKTRITFIDRNCKNEMEEFKHKSGELFKLSRSRYIDADSWLAAQESKAPDEPDIPSQRFTTEYFLDKQYSHLVNPEANDREFLDIEWEFIKGDDHNPSVQKLLEEYALDPNAIITVAVCLNMTHVSLRSAMHLPKIYYEKEIPVLVQQRKTSTIVSTLNGYGLDEAARSMMMYRNIIPFGMVYNCYDLHLSSSVNVCKRIAAAYDYYSKNNNYPKADDLKDADKIWEEKTITKRWSNIFAAASIPTKLRCIGIEWDINKTCIIPELNDEQIEILSETEHNRWNIEELLLGYRPVSKEEDKQIDEDKSKKGYWKKRFAHYDIRPFECLKTDNQGNKANVYDKVIVISLPAIMNSNETKS